ncbi:isopentenyl phosphate kinase [Halobacterium yunchengense]|uniref:isopentenyl phosphate kinase n=1 Tax=Halobacterium yunchengense TaxID=3108497 RepID=UPI00300B2C76
MTVVVKLGGSVVTEKDSFETVDEDALAALAAALGDAAVEDLVVVHGAGSFGHPHAADHGMSSTTGSRDAGAVRAVADTMERLNRAVVGALADAGVPAVPVHPYSASHRTAEGDLRFPTGHVDAMLGEGFVPVLHGDPITHVGEGASILSGDEVVTHVAAELDADRVGLCSTVPGVLDESGSVVGEITDYGDVAAALGDSDATDVTGGMAAKVRSLLDLGAPAYVFGPADLEPFLAGDHAGTRIEG